MQDGLVELILVLLVVRWVAFSQQFVVVVPLSIDILNRNERDALIAVIHFLICSFGERR